MEEISNPPKHNDIVIMVGLSIKQTKCGNLETQPYKNKTEEEDSRQYSENLAILILICRLIQESDVWVASQMF